MQSIFPSFFLGVKIGLITSDKNIIFASLLRFLSEITHLFPQNQKISNNAGEGERETRSVRHFVFFLHRQGGLHFLIGLFPKGSPIITTKRLFLKDPTRGSLLA